MRAPCLLLLLLTGLLPGRADAFGSCAEPGYLAGFEGHEGAGPGSCRTLMETAIRWRGGSAPLRVITITGAPTPALDEVERAFVARVESLAGRVGPAMDRIGGLALGEITILLSDGTFRNFHAATKGRPECKIVFYKLGRPVSDEEFLFTLSHEIFHCIQVATWPRAHDGAEAYWWMEGSAEYFASLANPGSELGGRFVRAFDDASQDTSLLRMNYPAVVFFLWLGHDRGPEALAPFLAAMATSAGESAQHAALLGRMPIDAWIEFGQAYLDSRIRMPDGSELPSLVSLGDITTVEGPIELPLSTREFMLPREQLLFRKGRTYRLAMVGGSGDPHTRVSEGGGEWGEVPERVLACDEDVLLVVLTVSTTAGESTHTLKVEDSERIDERACCLIGEWAPTPESVQAEVNTLLSVGGPSMAAYGLNFSCGVIGGGWRLVFDAEGEGEVRWQGFTYKCVATAPGGGMSQTNTRNGTTSFRWDVTEPGVGMATYTGNSLAWTLVQQFGPHVNTMRRADAGPSTDSNGFAYQCDADRLTVQGIYGLNQGQATYLRRGAGGD